MSTEEHTNEPATDVASLYREVDRAEWAALASGIRNPLSETEVVQLRGIGDRLDLTEVREVYLPLSRLLSTYAENTKRLGAETAAFLREPDTTTPFVVGVAGSVAVGKSTIARLLRELMSRWPGTPRVELVTTDGFLYPNAELERRGIMSRKGFPESYDRRALVRFLTDVKSGAAEARAPFYSHVRYDIVPDAYVTVRRPDVVIVEGLNVLSPPPTPNDVAVSDLFDFSIFVDADADDIAVWYVDRFLALREGAFSNPSSFFNVFAELSDAEAVETALGYWNDINLPNLRENVEPTKHRATLVLGKAADHTVRSVLLRKL
ncbi:MULTISPECIES: type I pantothenate kinase [Microbacterium]|jgi:type I pantothenate kinase|uniref:type I pantothenate kinase n=1 Tax=Microbacterium TaxID=33882 RepID=UPI0019BF987B|nr:MULTISPECIES: type I pantothenate kinase [Microbacterium]MBD3756687.1 type I pantothenate kinase [Microbacterium sp.]MBZ6373071.1 type I pantothenate kinase [Microbacterium hominis]MCG7413637.1 type I pantothenate kinase [Microbacterium aurum]